MMSQRAAELLAAYHELQQREPENSDDGLVLEAKALLEQELAGDAHWTLETVRLACRAHMLLDDKAAIIDLLRAYLQRDPSIEDSAWARWHLADHLAMSRRCAEAVAQQKDNLQWTRHILPQPTWTLTKEWPFSGTYYPDRVDPAADEVLLLRMMSDGTQAFCWQMVGAFGEWMHIFHEIMAQTAPTHRNRADRRYYLRTAGALCIKQQDADAALTVAEGLKALSAEDSAWAEAFEVDIEADELLIQAYHLKGDQHALRQTAERSIQRLNQRVLSLSSAQESEVIAMLLHNFAAPLYRIKAYELAIPLFRKSIELGNSDPYSYWWLAACVWAATQDRAETLTLLKQGAPASRLKPYILRTISEFEDVAQQPDFAAILT
ncbi:MAG: hypothetical protein U0694_15965 [Anaerolineae bacterium]